MTPENFCYWLQGFFEITGVRGDDEKTLNPKQIKMIEQHLGYVFSTPQETPETAAEKLLTEEDKKRFKEFEKSLKKIRPPYTWGSDAKIC